MSKATAGYSRHMWGWSRMKRQITEWRQSGSSRTELLSFSDRYLQDIGISRCAANFESSKPFWIA
jgi:uncharacterized protein YjiS (DUF1127 family)